MQSGRYAIEEQGDGLKEKVPHWPTESLAETVCCTDPKPVRQHGAGISIDGTPIFLSAVIESETSYPGPKKGSPQ